MDSKTINTMIESMMLSMTKTSNNPVFNEFKKAFGNDDDTKFINLLMKYQLMNNAHILIMIYINTLQTHYNVPYRCIDEYINKYILIDPNINRNIYKLISISTTLTNIKKTIQDDIKKDIKNMKKYLSISSILRLTISLIENNISSIRSSKKTIEGNIFGMNDI